MKISLLLMLGISALLLSSASETSSPNPTPTETSKKEKDVRSDKKQEAYTNNSPSKKSPSVLDPDSTPGNANHTHDSSNHKSEPPSASWITWFTGILAGVATLQLGILCMQVWLVRRGLKINKLLERAWLSVTFDHLLEPKEVDSKGIEFTIRNHGHSVAFIKDYKLRGMSWGPKSSIMPDRPLDPKPTGKLTTKYVLFPNQSMIAEGPLGFNLTSDMINGDCIFDVYGHVAYNDIFGVRHMTRFCQVYNSRTGGFDFPREAQPEYNDAD